MPGRNISYLNFGWIHWAAVFHFILSGDRGGNELSRETPSVLCMCKHVYLWNKGESVGKVHELAIDLESGIHSKSNLKSTGVSEKMTKWHEHELKHWFQILVISNISIIRLSWLVRAKLVFKLLYWVRTPLLGSSSHLKE